MKINWGTGIVISFIAFIAFIMYFVVIASTQNSANHDLVTEKYYQQELAYQEEIDAEINTRDEGLQIKFSKTAEGLSIELPNNETYKSVRGKMFLYRPSNKYLDFDLPVSLSNTHLLIPDNQLLDGRWDIKLRWEYKGKKYLIKESINY